MWASAMRGVNFQTSFIASLTIFLTTKVLKRDRTVKVENGITSDAACAPGPIWCPPPDCGEDTADRATRPIYSAAVMSTPSRQRSSSGAFGHIQGGGDCTVRITRAQRYRFEASPGASAQLSTLCANTLDPRAA